MSSDTNTQPSMLLLKETHKSQPVTENYIKEQIIAFFNEEYLKDEFIKLNLNDKGEFLYNYLYTRPKIPCLKIKKPNV